MKRIEKVGEYAVKAFTLPLRIGVGLYKAVKKEMPDKVEMPFEFKRKEETNGEETRNNSRTI
jgi:hypothetical protein